MVLKNNFQIKRIFAVFLVCFILVPFLALGISASEPAGYTFDIVPSVSSYSGYDFISDSDIAYYEGFVPEGRYNFRYCFSDNLGFHEFSSRSPVDIFYTSEFDGFPSAVFSSAFSQSDLLFTFDFVLVDCTSSENMSGLIFSVNGDVISLPEGSYFEFLPVDDDSSDVTEVVTSSLSGVIGWIALVVNSLTSGALTPLLVVVCVPISVTALVFSIKAIRKSSWGA